MVDKIKVIGIAGSLRKNSYNKALLSAAKELAPENVSIEIFDIDGIPGFNQELEATPPDKIKELKAKVRASDAVLFVTPEFNYSVPGVLKNVIDWASRPYGDSAWEGKPVAVMSASIGMLGGARAQYHLRQMFVFLNMHPVNKPEVMVPFAADRFGEKGELKDEMSRKLVQELVRNLADWAIRLRSK